MPDMKCPKCGRAVDPQNGAAFCPFCGSPLKNAAQPEESPATRELLKRADAEQNPVKKHDLLLSALAAEPNSLAVCEALLYLGRLYERSPRVLDYSVIKCYLLMIYLEPDTVPADKRDAMCKELFEHPDLERCLALCDDRNAFLSRYLTRISGEFISLFLRGSSRYMHRLLGFGIESRAPRYLAAPCCRMIAAMVADKRLTMEQRMLLAHAMFAAFSNEFNGDTQFLSQALQECGVDLD